MTIDPSDPRHGSTNGYRLGCRDACCRAPIAAAAAKRRARKYIERTDTLLVDSTGTVRRIQALVALGWSYSEISRRCGYQRSHIALILKRPNPIRQATDERIKAVYKELSMSLPPQDTRPQRIDASRARNMAAREGFHPPLAWDDDAIDDPNATPHVGTKKRNPHHEQTDERHATLADLDTWGYGISEACRRLNTSRDALEAWSYRHGEADVYQRLVERENYAEKVNGATVERRVS